MSNLLEEAIIIISANGSDDGKINGLKPSTATFVDIPYTRGSRASITNSQKLNEIISAVNRPRLDFSEEVAKWLIEYQSTNLIIFPLSFGKTYWNKAGLRVEGDANTAGVERVINGSFATDTDWQKGTGITISGGKANFTGNPNENIRQNNVFLNPVMYMAVFTITDYVSGSLNINFGGAARQGNYSANDTYAIYSNASGDNNLFFQETNESGGFVGSVSNVSVKEVQGFSSPSVNDPTSAIKLIATDDNSFIRRTTLGDNNTIYSNLLYVKRISGTGNVYLKGTNNVNVEIALTTEWKAFNLSVLSSSTDIYTGIELETSGDEIMIFGAQLEKLPFSTSLMLPPTEGSTFTRLKDNPTSVPIASTVTGAIVRDNYIQNYAGNTPSLITMKSNTNRIITYGRQILASEITCAGLTEAVFMLDIKSNKEFSVTVSGTGVVYWGDGESHSYDGTEIVLTHTFVKVANIVAFIGTLTFWKSITADVNYFHSLSSLPRNITSYENIAANETYGSINDLPSTIISYENRGLNQVNSYTSGKVFSSDIIKFIHLPVINFGLTSAMVDNLLIDLESSGMSSGVITLNGQNEARTSASDVAVTSLENKGVTVTTN